MKSKILKIFVAVIMVCFFGLTFAGCSKAETVTHNIKTDADQFKTYRKVTFVNLYTNSLLYCAEGYFSVQTTYSNEYQGQQEIGLVFKIGENEYKMDYFSIDNNVAYVIEQSKNTTTNPYYWNIVWYVPLPNNIGA